MRIVVFLLLNAFLSFSVRGQDPCPSYEAARDFLSLNELDRAKVAIECRVREFPQDRDLLRLYGDVLRKKGNTAEAAQIFQRVYHLALQNPKDDDLAVYSKRQTSHFSLATSYQSVWTSGDRHSNEFGFDGTLQPMESLGFGLGFDRISKGLPGGLSLEDSVYRGSLTAALLTWSYVESLVSYSPEAHFSPTWKLGLEPHFVVHDETDLSLGLRLGLYEHSTVFLLRPGLSTRIFSNVILRLTADVELRPERAVAGAGFYEIQASPRMIFRPSVGGGTTDDGDGILDTFWSFGAEMRYRIFIPLELNAAFSFYNGKNRDENRIGAGIHWIF